MPSRKAKPSYGPSDLDRFSCIPADLSHITPDDNTNVSLGDGKIGKVEVQCHFLHEQSQWGRLQRKDGSTACAGIIHMKIVFKNLRECLVESAVIRVVLDGEHQLLQSYRKIVGQNLEEQEGKLGFKKKANTVEVTEVGPRSIVGTPFGVVQKTALMLNPTAEAQGISFSAIQASREKEWTQITRWVFEGDTWATSKSGIVNSAEWTLTENVPEGDPSHGKSFRTAFVFANDGHPFLLSVQVEGSLRSARHRAKEHLKRTFKFGSGSVKSVPTTLIGGFETKTKRLNKLAARLNEDMNELNKAIDFNRPVDGQARDSGPSHEIEDDEEQVDDRSNGNSNLKTSEGGVGSDEVAKGKHTTEFVALARMMAESGKGQNQMNGSIHHTKPPPHEPQATHDPQSTTVQDQESKTLLNLLFEFWYELLARIQQLLLLG